MNSRRLYIIIALTLLLVAVTGCGVCSCPFLSRRATPAPTPVQEYVSVQPTSVPPDVIAEADAEERLLINIYKRLNPAVVHIRVTTLVDVDSFEFPSIPDFPDMQMPEDDFYQEGSGSGFLIDRDGHIVTNNHVVEGAEEVQVAFYDGTTVRADIVGTDPDSDLAVIKVELPAELGDITPAELGDSDAVEIGQRAIALGNPYGLRGTLTAGIVSALGRSLPLGRASAVIGARFSIPELIQTDAAILPGNSGGPLLDSQGRVIGVNMAYDPTEYRVGFAVPVNTVKRVVPKLIEDGYYPYPWLGISGTDLSLEVVEQMNLPVQRGAIVLEVTPDSPADEAGVLGSDATVETLGRELPIGGDVIIAIDEQKVEQFEDILVYILRETEVGQRVDLTIIRDGHERVITVRLAERPSQ
jgi:S1-C subfamily serine protease